jgi:hypothetical protein
MMILKLPSLHMMWSVLLLSPLLVESMGVKIGFKQVDISLFPDQIDGFETNSSRCKCMQRFRKWSLNMSPKYFSSRHVRCRACVLFLSSISRHLFCVTWCRLAIVARPIARIWRYP